VIIDAYAHVFPDPLINALLAVRPSAEMAGLRQQSPHLRDADRRLAYMDRHGFDKQVLVRARPPVWLGLERSHVHRLTRIATDSIAGFCAGHPDHFIGVGVLPVVDDCLMEELERLRGELGLRGVLIFSNIEGLPVDDPSMAPLYARGAEVGLPIWIHPLHAPLHAWVRRDLLDRMVAWPFDTTLAMARLVLEGVFDRHPTLKVVTHHMGGMVPYYARRIEAFADDMVEAYSRLGMADQSPRGPGRAIDHFRRFYNDSVCNGSAAALRCALDFFGADHICFGTDVPFGPEHGERWPLDELQVVRAADISESDRELILHGTLERLLEDRGRAV